MKKFTAMAAVAVTMVIGGRAMAYNVPENPTDVEVYAQMASTLQITITSATTFDFQTLTSNEQKVSYDVTTLPSGFVIQNTGGGLTQTYQLNVEASANWGVLGIAGAPGADQFAMDAVFSSAVPPAPANFSDATDRLPLGAETFLPGEFIAADATNMADGSQTGLNVPFNGVRNLFLRITAPVSSGATARQRIQVNVRAVAP